ncbi:LL-diaminopimelate aminotransferase [Waterburya agarophytonicola K14]|uniref:LL-diaminopimelate aminotransferase n=1 Tax=Waterburya agarophytonicola KI4 TaxID=2874699 RepID=A0A964FHJ4_9CYAN|nr:LL-diaminopimelate aminotransferase [Waterburya agarophytonicola]MCC0177553.1 LL-diaminopimelate aminotransferase [Waterburya agarophytonicola KI4]
MQFANRLKALSHNVFADMDRAKTDARNSGKEIIDLSLGSSDLPVAPSTIAPIKTALQDPDTHGYLLHAGTKDFRVAAAHWYRDRFGISVDPETEVLQLIGSQEGTAHLPLAILNPGDIALLLDPGYPSHAGGVYLAGGEIYPMTLLAEHDFLPVLGDIPPAILAQSKMMVLSYPHNPTTAIAPLDFFHQAVDFCREHNLVLVHDFPYVDLVFDREINSAPSILQADIHKELSIEFFTLSKSYNMGGFRIGYAIGNQELIAALRKVKAVVDFNQYRGILDGAIAALSGSQTSVTETVTIFKHRRDVFIRALNQIGWQVPSPEATMYIWAKLPEPWQNNSIDFCTKLVSHTGVAASPGAGFGQSGEGYVRFALVKDPETLRQAAKKIEEFLAATTK